MLAYRRPTDLPRVGLLYAAAEGFLAVPVIGDLSLAYQLPVLTALRSDPKATALYLSPTKALGAGTPRPWWWPTPGRP